MDTNLNKAVLIIVAIGIILAVITLGVSSITNYHKGREIASLQEDLRFARAEIAQHETEMKAIATERNKANYGYTSCERQVSRIKSLASRPIEAIVEALGNISKDLADVRIRIIEEYE